MAAHPEMSVLNTSINIRLNKDSIHAPYKPLGVFHDRDNMKEKNYVSMARARRQEIY